MSIIDNEFINSKEGHWNEMFSQHKEMFGNEESEPARDTDEFLKKEGKNKILELGGGQGRDTFFFANKGYDVTMLDYSSVAIDDIKNKAKKLNLNSNLELLQHDLREPLPFEDNTFDACYSHMLFCMAFSSEELKFLSNEIHRVLKDDGIHIYTARTKDDSHYGKGRSIGDDMYEIDGFIVHFFDNKLITDLSEGYEIIKKKEFLEGELPRKLCEVVMKKQ